METKEATVIELTDEQARQLAQPEPIAIDPRTRQAYVLVRREAYERLKALLAMDEYDPEEGAALVNEVMAEDDAGDPLLEGYRRASRLLARMQEVARQAPAAQGLRCPATPAPAAKAPGAALPDIPPGVRRSQEAFWRDLPELLRDRSKHGKWVCYHGDERIGTADSDEPLIRACLLRGVPDNAFHLDLIEPWQRAPWEAGGG
jgi:hypothetical protein